MAALAGLAIQLAATVGLTGSTSGALWVMARFFTIIGNLLVLVAFLALAMGRPLSPRLIGGTMLTILLVGIVHFLLLRGLLELSGGAQLADTLLHQVTPALVPLWWLAFARKGDLGWIDPWFWTLLPACYLPYALARGLMGGKYPYPFLNIDKLGWGGVAVNALVISLGYILAGHLVVWIDHRLARS